MFFRVFVKFNVALTDKMVAFHAHGFWGFAFWFMEEFVSQHGFADVDSAVVDDVDFENICACFFQDAADAFSQGIVAHVAKVEWFVCVWA